MPPGRMCGPRPEGSLLCLPPPTFWLAPLPLLRLRCPEILHCSPLPWGQSRVPFRHGVGGEYWVRGHPKGPFP